MAAFRKVPVSLFRSARYVYRATCTLRKALERQSRRLLNLIQTASSRSNRANTEEIPMRKKTVSLCRRACAGLVDDDSLWLSQ